MFVIFGIGMFVVFGIGMFVVFVECLVAVVPVVHTCSYS